MIALLGSLTATDTVLKEVTMRRGKITDRMAVLQDDLCGLLRAADLPTGEIVTLLAIVVGSVVKHNYPVYQYEEVVEAVKLNMEAVIHDKSPDIPHEFSETVQ